ncbi:tRNA dimethylallyltransferase [Pseudocercospora fuligena]|uniref:tRNA dimethylallyltransferase n=1 Tax=Pseudocercospora fuligena TaxID=685502 RepID=A0A8H6VFB7_9PEZI|nr:tRNA dimethylallyltransferase [Pseudocercospora fuligena]
MHIPRLGRLLSTTSKMTRIPPRNPLIAIIGATGTGKSQLAVEIAKRYNGEVINGDAMQLYEGLPIITNKITPQEQEGIPHHLLGCIGLQEQTWVVGTFVRKALKVIEEIRSRGRLPILVGGTHYYTQSLLFKDRLAESDEAQEERDFVADTSDKWPILKEPTEILLEELKKIDPVMAERWHPNDRRKIHRSLEIFLQTGQRASDIYAEQRSEQAMEGAEMRFPTLLFWVHAEQQTLRARLDARVDKMLAQGLLQEVETLDAVVKQEKAKSMSIDDSKGIWVSIGYKEFIDYVQARRGGEADAQGLLKLHAASLEKTKAATRQYSKRQVRWIRIKLLNALADADAIEKLYLLDGSDVSQYEAAVVQPALDLTGQFLRAEDMSKPASLSNVAAEQLQPKCDDLASKPEDWAKQYCAVCDVTSVTPTQWQQHITSNGHKKRASKQRQRDQAMSSSP